MRVCVGVCVYVCGGGGGDGCVCVCVCVREAGYLERPSRQVPRKVENAPLITETPEGVRVWGAG